MIASKNLQDVDVLFETVSSATGLSRDAIADHLQAAKIKSFRYADMILVSPDDFDVMIDQWAESIKRKLQILPSSPEEDAIASNVNSVEDDIEADVIPSEGLSWPDGFENVVTHLYTHTLKRILPDDPTLSRQFLDAIAHQTSDGQRLTEELANAIVKRSKRQLSKEKLKAGLIAKCSQML